MRLVRLRLSHFMGVQEREVRFAPTGVTVVEGPNESGKTTLLAAFDLLLDALDTSTSAKVRDAQSRSSGIGPRVEAEFLTGGRRVVYAKRWLSNRETMATITETDGRVVHLSGREAHEQVERLVRETSDMALWRALRLTQDDPTAAPDLARSVDLRTALERAAGGQMGGQGEQTLLDRVAAERRQYLTDHGRPTGAYREALDSAARAGSALEQAKAAADEASGVVARVASGRARLVEVARELEEAREAAGRADQEARAVGEAQATLRERTRAEEARAAQAELCDHAQKARAELVRREAVARARREELVRAEEAAGESLQTLGKSLSAAREAHDAAKALAEKREGDVRTADAALRHAHIRSAVQSLQARLKDAGGIEAEIADVDRRLGANRVDDDALAEVTRLDGVRAKAEARLEADAARLRVAAEREITLTGGGEAVTLPAGQVAEYTVGGRLDLEVGGVLALTVEGGGGGARLGRAADDARRALAAVLAACGVDSMAEARRRHAERSGLESRRDELGKALDRVLAGDTPDILRARLEELVKQLAPHEAAPDETEEQHDDAALTAALETAKAALQEAHRTVEARRGDLEGLEREAAALKEKASFARMQAREAKDEAEGLERELAAARAQASDEELAANAREAAERLGDARGDRVRAKEALDALDPDSVEQTLKSATGRRTRLEKDRDDLNRQLHSDEGYLRALSVGGEGVAERLAAAEAAAERSRRSLAAVQARAEAADLLLSTLENHRNQALKAYREPYRQEIEHLGRLVFGRDFAVLLDHGLRIEQRQLGGISLSREQLSTGAQEQLAVVARLACARLVSEEGAPVILDDAFSYSDPERLAGVCLALDRVGEDRQVVLLTCMPDRYRTLGSATVIRLERQTAEPVSATVATLFAAAADEAAYAQDDGGIDPEEKILLVLRRGGEPLGKQEILSVAQVREAEWPRTIRALLDSGRVEQIGAKRGARYRAAPGSR